MIKWIKSLFAKPHKHKWELQYTTGHNGSKWQHGSETGYSRSGVYKCECGKQAVKHFSQGIYHILN